MKKLLYITIPSLLIASLLYLFIHYPGYVKISWLDYNISMSIAAFIMITAALIFISYYAIRLLINIVNLPQKIRTYYSEKNIKDHLTVLEQGISSLISQDKKSLTKYAKKLNSNYNHSIVLFFQAELAILEANLDQAKILFTKLKSSKTMAFTGYYGLMRVTIIQKQYTEAIKWGYKALSYYPQSTIIRKKLVDIFIDDKQYDNALKELKDLEKYKCSDFVLYKKEVIWFKTAHNLYKQKKLTESMDYLQKILEINPSLYKALSLHLVIAKQLKLEKKSIKAIEIAWQNDQNDEIVKLYLEAKNTKTTIEKFQAVQRLSGFLPDSPDSLLINAKFAVQAQLWDEAKNYLNALIAKKVYMEHAYSLLATIESRTTKQESMRIVNK